MPRASIFERGVVGLEATQDTPVQTLRRLMGITWDIDPNKPITMVKAQGSKAPIGAVGLKESTDLNIKSVLAYNELIYLLEGAVCQGVVTTPGGATNTRRWTYNPKQSDPDTCSTFTVAGGSSAAAARVAGVSITDLGFTINDKAADLTGKATGRNLQDGLRVQNLYLTGAPGSGTWTATYAGQTAVGLSYAITAANLQTALEALSNIDPGDILVLGAAGGPWTVEFLLTGQYGKSHIAAFTVDGTGLTGGSAPAAKVGLCLDGLTVTEVAHVPIEPGSVSVYVADTYGAIASGKLSNLVDVSLNFQPRHKGYHTIDAALPSWAGTIEEAGDPVVQIVVEQNSAADQYMDHLRNRDILFGRIAAVGPLTEAGHNYAMTIDFPFTYTNPKRGDKDGLFTGTYDLACTYEPGFGSYMSAIIDTLMATT